MHTGVHRFLAFEFLVNPPSSVTLVFSLCCAPFLPASDSPATHTGSSASPSLVHSLFPGTSSDTLPPYHLLRHSGFLTSTHAFPHLDLARPPGSVHPPHETTHLLGHSSLAHPALRQCRPANDTALGWFGDGFILVVPPERATGCSTSPRAHACFDPALREDTTPPSLPRVRPYNDHICLRLFKGDPTNVRLPPTAPYTASTHPCRCPGSCRAPTQHPRTPHAGTTEHTRPCMHPLSPRKQAFLHMAAVRSRLWQQDCRQCTWHGIGRLSSRRHGDRMSGSGSPCGAIFLVLGA